MSDLDPGPGWREVTYEQWRGDDVPVHGDTAYVRVGSEERFYWREVPVPALPNAPYTVIRATWLPGGHGSVKETYALAYQGRWINVNTGVRHEPPELQAGVTDWEVLSEPPVVTAKAVGQRIYERLVKQMPGAAIEDTMHEFGVES